MIILLEKTIENFNVFWFLIQRRYKYLAFFYLNVLLLAKLLYNTLFLSVRQSARNMDFKNRKTGERFWDFLSNKSFLILTYDLKKSPCPNSHQWFFCFSLFIYVVILVLLRLYCEKLKANKAVIDQFITTKKVGLWMLDR